jgi:hypothetical protein
MKKAVVLILFQLIVFLCTAQVTLQPLLPQAALFQKSQLWNILAVNGSANTYDCYLLLSLQDRETGTEVLSATTAFFTLGKEAKQLNTAVLTPIQYTYISFTGDKTNDFLPVGSYTACFKLMEGKQSVTLAEACVPFDVEPLSPPMLISPADSSVLQTPPAQFTWQPPAPLMMFQQLHYELVIAEILPGQKPEEAVELNAPFYMDLNLPGSFMNYTGAYPSFEKGKWYAWQVVAEDGISYAAKTAVRTFTLANGDQALTPLNDTYLLLQDDVTGTYLVNKGILHIKYFSFDKENVTTVLFSTDNGNVVDTYKQKIVQGDNYLDFKLGSSYQSGKIYKIVITDLENKKHFLAFRIQ